MTTSKFIRPALDEARPPGGLLSRTGCPPNRLDLPKPVHRAVAHDAGLRYGFQTKFTADDDALDIAYDHFCESTAPIVFYRSARRRTSPCASCSAIRGLRKNAARRF